MYARFQKLNGKHPWRVAAPGGYVDYAARRRPGGRLLYFNFDLAREMGLIAQDHPDSINPSLEKAALDAFCLEVINEWDRKHRAEILGDASISGPYMATRYLQQQHRDKCGRTSGDGRSIWNGCLRSGGISWDVSSRGTGATRLSPGAQAARGLIRTGDETRGYASGRADVDEMLGGAILSEIFHRRGIRTERCLAVIDFPDGSAVGVRASPNLLRPAHLFRFLKMGRRGELQKAFDYFLERQEANGEWDLPRSPAARYRAALDLLAEGYAKLGAQLLEEYIFAWFSWDGDNLLLDGSLLDYGSIRQFAALHDRYRYKDVDRFSTSLPEQRRWLRLNLQTLAQAADFILTGDKRKFAALAGAPCLGRFDTAFYLHLRRLWLWRLGFTGAEAERLIRAESPAVDELLAIVGRLEKAKVRGGPEKVPDGITHYPAYIVRNLLRELPGHLAEALAAEYGGRREPPLLAPGRLNEWLRASYSQDVDVRLTGYRRRQLRRLQVLYWRLVRAVPGEPGAVLESMRSRSRIINFGKRLTGDGLVWIIKDAMNARRKLPRIQWQGVLDLLVESQVLLPGRWKPLPAARDPSASPRQKLLGTVQRHLDKYKETL